MTTLISCNIFVYAKGESNVNEPENEDISPKSDRDTDTDTNTDTDTDRLSINAEENIHVDSSGESDINENFDEQAEKDNKPLYSGAPLNVAQSILSILLTS